MQAALIALNAYLDETAAVSGLVAIHALDALGNFIEGQLMDPPRSDGAVRAFVRGYLDAAGSPRGPPGAAG